MTAPERADDLDAIRRYMLRQADARWWIDRRDGGEEPQPVRSAMAALALGDDPALLRLPPDLVRLAADVRHSGGDAETSDLLAQVRERLSSDPAVDHTRRLFFNAGFVSEGQLHALLLVASQHAAPEVQKLMCRLRVYAALALTA